jgi:hypothetical protein
VYEIELIVRESFIFNYKFESWHLLLGHLSDGKLLELGKFSHNNKFVA